MNWQAASVLPRASGVLETRLRKLARGLLEIGAARKDRESKRAGSIRAPGPCHFNKEQTPPGDLFDPSPRIHGGCFGV